VIKGKCTVYTRQIFRISPIDRRVSTSAQAELAEARSRQVPSSAMSSDATGEFLNQVAQIIVQSRCV
jgi:hypothetical protein